MTEQLKIFCQTIFADELLNCHIQIIILLNILSLLHFSILQGVATKKGGGIVGICSLLPHKKFEKINDGAKAQADKNCK